MLVMVKFVDGNIDMVVSSRLDTLIKAGKILEFRRGSGWARIGREPIRRSIRDFNGEDRRKIEITGQMIS